MVYEYYLQTGDLSLLKETFPKLQKIVNACTSRMAEGLLPMFEQTAGAWNFYEWTDNLSGKPTDITSPYETPLNCLYSIALGRMQAICDWLGEKADFLSIKNSLNQKIAETFYNKEQGLFVDRLGSETYSELTNALAILCGAATGEMAEKIAETLAGEHQIVKCSLSMVCFKYDALITVNKEKYRDYILADIDATYGKMLAEDATSFWETENGQIDFGKAASLCHGWSAMPVYYYHTLKA
jgi:glycogen debranching enzyme